MTALAYEITVPAYPLGEPFDGRPRYGMTPEMAEVYRWLVQHKPHHGSFAINFRETGWRMARHYTALHRTVQGLVERGWLECGDLPVKGAGSTYSFVHPVKQFKAPRHG